ncbi:cytochrome d ubiquinol oxidase subunit II [Rickettsia endosymbiont of Cardiosporidium cionae]|uniref:cytochrome d ubiquinol oxidase subunit II n=1 Tax=Rickettsia endosymbiont of Cardiosporidium cionae TaxID=2777155 RepID=UPI0018945169|nr:cytochrome d ubiquinol oxidase subunit II [Rickettsia endosymbiont of Cardiosporidium cionae]KAF8818112.1 cytochrome d ubiquinol oxidase subunit II [Rickettsia endosymbiont of Cardiosporidium cionae]
MLNFEKYLNLPVIWVVILACIVLFYVILDGFDLGIGILLPFAPSSLCRDKMLNSMAPFWDGNETWLVLGGTSLFMSFPLAYSIITSKLYIPIHLMLISLIFRGTAFEFRSKSLNKVRQIWEYVFHFGSIFVAFFQGMLLGCIVQGIDINEYSGEYHVITGFSVMTGIALIFGYALLGSTWLIMKTEYSTQSWARKTSVYSTIYVVMFMIIVSLWVPFIHDQIFYRWFSFPNIIYLSIIPILVILVVLFLIKSIERYDEKLPFIFSICLFILGYIGIIISLWPWIVPYKISIIEASASSESQSIALIGVVLIIPIILCYTGYIYYVFRDKATHGTMY